MLIETGWLDAEKTTILVRYPRQWSEDDWFQSMQVSYSLMDSVPYPVDVIHDATMMRDIPSHILRIAPETERLIHSRRGVMIFVGVNVFVQALMRAARYIAPNAVRDSHVAKTMEDALGLLRHLRAARETNQGVGQH